MAAKIAVGILGCTGAVGQKFVALLAEHPWFEVTELAASERSAGKFYGEQVVWKEARELPPRVAALKIKRCLDPLHAQILFSGLDSTVAGEVEAHYAQQGHMVISNSKNHRMVAEVPLLIPEINLTHLQLLTQQPYGSGKLITNPNCAVIILALALYRIYQNFGLSKVLVTTMQAISGAGYPGVPALDILGNLIPHIPDEEAKLESELLKIFGSYEDGKIKLANFPVSAACNRVPVINGHTMAISFATERQATREELIRSFSELPQLGLPSSPREVVKYFESPWRPQPLADVNTGAGMTVVVGNLRPCPVLAWKMTALGHNTIRGAAGAAILNAEYLVAHGGL